MADDLLPLNPGVGGRNEDIETLSDPGAPVRQRVQIGGAIRAEVARVLASSPTGSEMALVVRTLPSFPTTSGLQSAAINAAGLGDNILVAGVALQTIRVFRLFMVIKAAADVTFKDGVAALTGPMSMTPSGNITLDLDEDPWFVTSAGNDFILNLSAGVQVSGRLYYTQS